MSLLPALVFGLLIPFLVESGEVHRQNDLAPFSAQDVRFAHQAPEVAPLPPGISPPLPDPTNPGPFPPSTDPTNGNPGPFPPSTDPTNGNPGPFPPLSTDPTNGNPGPFPPTTPEPTYPTEPTATSTTTTTSTTVPTYPTSTTAGRPYVTAKVIPVGEYVPLPTVNTTPVTILPVTPEFYPATTQAPSTTTTTTAAPTTTTAAPTETAKLYPVKIVPEGAFEPLPPVDTATSGAPTQTVSDHLTPEFYTPAPNVTNGTNGTNTSVPEYVNAHYYSETTTTTASTTTLPPTTPAARPYRRVKIVEDLHPSTSAPQTYGEETTEAPTTEEPTEEPTEAPTETPQVYGKSTAEEEETTPAPTTASEPEEAEEGGSKSYGSDEAPVKFVDRYGNVLDKPRRVYRSSFKAMPALLERDQVEDTLSTREQEELEETESLHALEKQIRRTDALLESVVDSLEALRNSLEGASSGKKSVAKHKVERDLLKSRLEKGLEDLNVDAAESPAFIEVGSQVIRRRNAASDETVFLELDDMEGDKEMPLSSLLNQEPLAASTNALSSTDERIEKLIAEGDAQQAKDNANIDDEEFAEVSSKLEKKKKPKKTQSSAVEEKTKRLRHEIESASKLTAQLEEFIRAKVPRAHNLLKKVPKRASFLDLSSTTTDQNDVSEDISLNLPSIESLRKRLSESEPQF